MSDVDQVQVETTGETVGEARWAALHELERRYPSLDRDAVTFVVLSEGHRGLLGVGYEPARVLATLTVVPAVATEPAPREPPSTPVVDESPAAAAVRQVLEHVVDGLGMRREIEIVEQEGVLTATVSGPDLGLLIGKHGQTIDALQYLCNAILHRREEDPPEVVIDAQGYRQRRERTLHEVAARAVDEVIRTGRPVMLDPMTSVERKIVHTHAQRLGGVETGSEGTEPHRSVVLRPLSSGEV
jgi:spoIIIJ-associated protein